MRAFSWCWLVLAALLLPLSVQARGGGGCVAGGTPVLTPRGWVAIERLQPGDQVAALHEGQLIPATVQGVVSVQPADFVELVLAGQRLRLTAEHPVQVAPGVFRAAGLLRPGDLVCRRDGAGRLAAVRHVPATVPAYNLLVMPAGTFVAGEVIVHNKGCFLPNTPILRADGSSVWISQVRIGDELRAFTTGGDLVRTTVRQIFSLSVDRFYVVATERAAVRVTAEHPFYVGQGTFKTVAALRPGDTVFAAESRGLIPQRVVSISEVAEPVIVYNLQTDAPHTFFAAGVAVHNKGGGCFLGDTPILRADGASTIISALQPGERLRAFERNGTLVDTFVREIFVAEAQEYFVLRAGSAILRATAEHPFYVGHGAFRTVAELRPGDILYAVESGALRPLTIASIERRPGPVSVFNVHTDAPHTFFAAGIAVHNKGFSGGGFRGSSRRSSGGSGKSWDQMSDAEKAFMVAVLSVVGLVFLGILVAVRKGNRQADKEENLDYLFPRREIKAKADKTQKLLEFLAGVDGQMAPDRLAEVARATFLQLQQCWQARAYAPMEALLMPDLYQDHLRQIKGMIRNHEINHLENLIVQAIDLVNVRYPHKANQREFTALVTASARDYYADDRNGEYLRGDASQAIFQEFWTFQWLEDRWRLREIEQTGESNILQDENFFEQFTDQGVQEIYATTAAQQGEAGPWLEGAVGTKAQRTERLLNFLVQTDKLWNREAMLRRARQVFLDLKFAQEKGDPHQLPDSLFPEVTGSLKSVLLARNESRTAVEYRNLCVRKAELILVRNFAENSHDEFTVRISAHAQRITLRDGREIGRDEYVAPFEEFLTFGRLDGQWKLKEIVPPARGRNLIDLENVDEDSNPEQLQWYYQQTRAT